MSGLPWEDDSDDNSGDGVSLETLSGLTKSGDGESPGLSAGIEALEVMADTQEGERKTDSDEASNDGVEIAKVEAINEDELTFVNAAELSAFGLPVNDGFWVAPANFDDFLEEWNAAESDEAVAVSQEPPGDDGGPDQGEVANELVSAPVEPVAAPVEPAAVLDVPNLGPNAPAALPRRSAQLNRYARPTLNPNDPVKAAMLANIIKANNERRIG